jgi:hypothetical protein
MEVSLADFLKDRNKRWDDATKDGSAYRRHRNLVVFEEAGDERAVFIG